MLDIFTAPLVKPARAPPLLYTEPDGVDAELFDPRSDHDGVDLLPSDDA